MAQGLLTATLPTKIGGDLDMVAREASLEFLLPVWTGQRIRCEATVLSTRPGRGRRWATIRVVCLNPAGEEVLRGRIEGFVPTGG